MASNYRTTRSNSRIATLNGLAYTPSLIDDFLSDQNATPGPSPAMVSDDTRLSDDGPTFHSTKRKRPRHDASTPRKVVRITSSKRRTATATVLPISSQQPENWRKVYDIIKGMRSNIIAPADTTGCEQSKHKESDPKNSRFTTLVYLMLSSQTKDEVTDAAVTKLQAAVGGTLSIHAILSTDESIISQAINKVGFWRRKAGYIKQAAQKLLKDFDSDVPKTFDELCSLPGVGPKMAILALHVAWDITAGIGVDSHVHRITNLLGWHKRQTKNPEETRLSLESWLPTEFHREINKVLVGFGQVICLPTRPRCDTCKVSARGLCPSSLMRSNDNES